MLLMPIALCLLLTPAPAQTAKAHYEAGERAAKEARWVVAGRELEQAATMAPNNERYQARFAEVRIRASQWAESAARILIDADRTREARSFVNDALRFDPRNAGAAELLEQLDLTNQRHAKLNAVQTVFVEKIEGDNGEMTREQIKAALANTGRFRVILREDKDNPADATITGRAELKEVETQTTISAQAQGTTQGAALGSGVGGSAGAIVGAFGRKSEKRSEHSTESKKTLTSESVVLSLTLKSGEVVWGWDDTRACNVAKAKCAVNDLVSAARR
jgi:hypothetical protein